MVVFANIFMWIFLQGDHKIYKLVKKIVENQICGGQKPRIIAEKTSMKTKFNSWSRINVSTIALKMLIKYVLEMVYIKTKTMIKPIKI